MSDAMRLMGIQVGDVVVLNAEVAAMDAMRERIGLEYAPRRWRIRAMGVDGSVLMENTAWPTATLLTRGRAIRLETEI